MLSAGSWDKNRCWLIKFLIHSNCKGVRVDGGLFSAAIAPVPCGISRAGHLENISKYSGALNSKIWQSVSATTLYSRGARASKKAGSPAMASFLDEPPIMNRPSLFEPTGGAVLADATDLGASVLAAEEISSSCPNASPENSRPN